MTPAARLAAAIGILDLTLAGQPAEQALTNWGRANRFAGSGDRAAIRDHVYDALRCRGSFVALGGGLSGRGLILGLARAQGLDIGALFTGARFAPAALSEQEAAHLAAPAPPEADLIRADWPDWLWPPLEAALGPRAQAVAAAMRGRAPVILRVNIARIPRAGAIDRLAAERITAEPHPLAETALEVTAGARGVARSAAYLEGLVELQDAASQAAVALVPVAPGDRVLDYCAGGGGKALAIAARAPRAVVSAHDADAARMRDIGPRAARAGAKIAVLAPGAAIAAQDLVVVDAPCSGSGTWRRTPEAKWRLTPERLAELVALQARILDEAAAHVRPGGHLAYFTCSLFDAENVDQSQAFIARSGWREVTRRRFDPTEGGDGFFAAIVQRPTA